MGGDEKISRDDWLLALILQMIHTNPDGSIREPQQQSGLMLMPHFIELAKRASLELHDKGQAGNLYFILKVRPHLQIVDMSPKKKPAKQYPEYE